MGKFEKFMTQKIQTNDLKQITATTGDNVVLETANVNWQITDVACAAKMAAETMRPDGTNVHGEDITKIREDVLKQCTASLSSFVGSLRYSDSTHVSTALHADQSQAKAPVAFAHGQPSASGMAGAASLFDSGKLKNAVAHANNVCQRYGVEIISINIISAFPVDKDLNEALAKGATAAAEAEQAETAAQGQAKALLIAEKAKAEAARIAAQADADADRIRAEGQTDAARKLEQSNVAVELARIAKTGE